MFFDEIAKNLGVSGVGGNNFSILNYAGLGVYIQGKISLKKHSADEILIKIGSENYSITGKSLVLRNLNSDAMYIAGKIFSIALEAPKN